MEESSIDKKARRQSRILNHRQRLFIEALFKLGVPTEAYRVAGYKGKGHSAETGAWLLMTNPNIKSEIERRLVLIDNQVSTRLRGLTDLALTTLKAIIMDREKRLTWDKKTKAYIDKETHMGASAGVRRQAISDLFGWVGLNPTSKLDVDARVKNQTLIEVIRAKKLLDRTKPTKTVRPGPKPKAKLEYKDRDLPLDE